MEVWGEASGGSGRVMFRVQFDFLTSHCSIVQLCFLVMLIDILLLLGLYSFLYTSNPNPSPLIPIPPQPLPTILAINTKFKILIIEVSTQ